MKHGATNVDTHIVDIAPTVCAMLHIQMPNGCVVRQEINSKIKNYFTPSGIFNGSLEGTLKMPHGLYVMHIAIAGNIGSGKTTLTTMLAKRLWLEAKV